MTKELLIENFPFQYSIVESSGDGRMILKGVCQRADAPNANKRVYPRSIFERIFEDSNINQAIKERRTFGFLNHPKPGEDPNDLRRSAIVLVNHYFAENGKDVIGEFEILPTPDGNIIKALCESNCTIGISSRGSGSVRKNSQGLDEVQNDYVFSTYDIVANPSTHQAYVRPLHNENNKFSVKEEVTTPKVETTNLETVIKNLDEKKENNLMLAQEKFAAIERKALDFLKIQVKGLNESTKSVVEPMASSLILDLSKFATENPDFKSLAESLISELNDKRKEYREVLTEGENPFAKMKKEKEDEDEDDEDKDDKKKKKKEMKEATKGSADTGFVRSVDYEGKPPAGEGWPVNPADAGVLSAYNQAGDGFMSEEDETMDKETDTVEHDENDAQEESMTESMVKIAEALVSIPETENNSVARAFAAAFLMEHSNRTTEAHAYSRIVTKLQEKVAAFAEGYDEELAENNKVLSEALEELTMRHKLLSAKVYAEAKLEEIGLRKNTEALRYISEVIAEEPTKSAIDAAISEIKEKVSTSSLKESVDKSKATLLEAKLSEKANEKTTSKTALYEGANLGKQISNRLREKSGLK